MSQGRGVCRLVEQTKKRYGVKRSGCPHCFTFTIVGNFSDGWAVRPDVVADKEEAAAGGISIKLYSPSVPDFDSYYFSLKPKGKKENKRNPWFKEFWQQKFECYLPQNDERDHRHETECTGN